MTFEEKTLLIEDLCSRLPYGVWIEDIHTNIRKKLSNIVVHPLYDGNNIKDYICSVKMFDDHYVDIACIRPLLYPMDMLTEEQRNMLEDMDSCCQLTDISGEREIFIDLNPDKKRWLDLHMFDYRGLIPRGLANTKIIS